MSWLYRASVGRVIRSYEDVADKCEKLGISHVNVTAELFIRYSTPYCRFKLSGNSSNGKTVDISLSYDADWDKDEAAWEQELEERSSELKDCLEKYKISVEVLPAQRRQTFSPCKPDEITRI